MYHTWKDDNGTYFKSVYRWNLDTQEPNLIIDKDGIVKVNLIIKKVILINDFFIFLM
ncbi:hypothetical protein [Spiroplasma citri]|uniref:hypothetical protein n=1 Tax=Spiroplasma citri TaxID=2133 RepID=UPI00286EBB02|nr:hypothetical protein [Spiroplasma citri]